MPTVAQYRRDLDELVRLGSIDLDVLWRQVADAVVARELLADILPALVDVYGTAAGTLAADWYDDVRDELEVQGRFSAIVAELPDRGRTDALAGWATSPLFGVEHDTASALMRAQGGLQRIIADVGRTTIMGSSIADPRASGWQRVTDGNGCGFCNLLASRGAVYSESSVDFGAHDHCGCSATPAFSGRPIPVKPFTPTSRNITDADRARTRDWMLEHGY